MSKDSELDELKKKVALYEEIMNQMMESILVTDTQEKIVWVNDAVCKMDGLDRGKAYGKTESDIWPKFNPPSCRHTLQTGKATDETFVTFFNTKGKVLDILTKTYPFRYKGKVDGVYSIGYYLGYSDQKIIRILEHRQRLASNRARYKNDTVYTFDDIIGNGYRIREVVNIAQKVATKNASILIYGQTGTGKELFAQGIHNASLNREGKFVALNCAAVPQNLLETTLFGSVKGAYTGADNKKGLLYAAQNGTLFLDEINSMPLSIQGKLLRVLQEKQFCPVGGDKNIECNCRVISACNQNPQMLVKNGILRQDLYFRLAVITLDIPALSQRKDDIVLLTEHFLSEFNKENNMDIIHIDMDCYRIFQEYSWPGNVRELRHVIEYMMNVTDQQDVLSFQDLPPYLREKYEVMKEKMEYGNENLSLKEILTNVEKSVLLEALKRNKGNITGAAKELKIHREAMYKKMERLSLDINQFRKYDF